MQYAMKRLPIYKKFFYDKGPMPSIQNVHFRKNIRGKPLINSGAKLSKIRKDFRDTAIWVPAIKTGANGIATVSVVLPDNLTTWRATVRGVTAETDVGSTINKIISTQDLIVRLALPRFFSLGDETSINAVVHNYTKETQPVHVILTLTPQFSVSKKLEQDIRVEPDKSERVSWPVKLIASGNATVTIKALGKTAADAMESEVNVLSLGLPAFVVKCGELLQDPSSITIPAIASNLVSLGSYKHQLSVSGSSIGPVLGNFDKLIDYPYGCTEQTMSRLIQIRCGNEIA